MATYTVLQHTSGGQDTIEIWVYMVDHIKKNEKQFKPL